MRYVFAILLLLCIAGMVWAADQSADTPAQPAASDTATTAAADADKPAEEPAADGTSAEPEKKKPTVFALTLGMYAPTNGTVKQVYGDKFVRMGIRPIPTNAPDGWRFAFDVNWVTMQSTTLGTLSENKATLIPLTAGVLRRFGKDDVKSYAALNVGPYYGHVRIPDVGIDKKGWGWDANFTLGTVYKERLCLEARYDLMSEFSNLDFSSLSFSIAYKMFTAKL